jgi:hypothetical protein
MSTAAALAKGNAVTCVAGDDRTPGDGKGRGAGIVGAKASVERPLHGLGLRSDRFEDRPESTLGFSV